MESYYVNISFNTELAIPARSTKFIDLISDQDVHVFQWVILAVACQSVDILGVGTNIINIICFTRQGFKDSINVSLFGLAISDLICVSTLIFTNLSFTQWFRELDLPCELSEVQYLVSAWPHVICTRITSWITAFITLERCLCITMPLKVKVIMTPRRAWVIIVTIFLILTVSGLPIYFSNKLDWTFSPERNRSILGIVNIPGMENLDKLAFALSNIITNCAFIVIITCTTVLVVNLRRQTMWRERNAVTKETPVTSTRDQRVARMVVAISAMFIVCFLPICITVIAMIVVPDLSIYGRYKNTFMVTAGLAIFLESSNSATNIFIYYHMSRKYKSVFRKLFRLSLEKGRA